MHPALSVILFTTASGAGYGIIFWLGVLGETGAYPPDRTFGLLAFGLGLGGITAGLLASTAHLGHPERAWRAFSQWRTSWLSREGVASLATYVPAGLFGIGWVFLGENREIWGFLGVLAAAASVVTIVCTAYIYRSLKTIQRWCNAWVLPNYLALAAMTGALWLDLAAVLTGEPFTPGAEAALCSIPVAAFLKFGYWRFIDATHSTSTAESATGLGSLGKVRLFEAPHTSDNYLMKEMGFHIARKHATKLRCIAVIAGFVLPCLLTAIALAMPGAIRVIAVLIAAPLATAGVLVERWLFFAEARHTVTLYYGASTA